MTKTNGLTTKGKIKASILSALVFFIVANPLVFKLMSSLFSMINPNFGSMICDENGCPTVQGLTLHSVIFGLIVYILMIV